MEIKEVTTLKPGLVALHFTPSTGRIIRTVEVLEVGGEAAVVRALNGKRKGVEYPVALDALHPAHEVQS